jgi:transcriptional regulator with XRE-family HTH domain
MKNKVTFDAGKGAPHYGERMFMGQRLFEARKAQGLSQGELGRMVGLSQPAIGQLESGETSTTKKVYELARVLEVKPSWLDPSIPDAEDLVDKVRVVGYLVEASEVRFADPAGDPYMPLKLAKRPAGASPTTVAIEIQSEALGAFFKGWNAYFDEVSLPLDDKHLTGLCVVRTAAGRVLVAKILKGTQPGRYHLVTQAGAITEDAEIAWASKVSAILPP